jgi:MFS family permease
MRSLSAQNCSGLGVVEAVVLPAMLVFLSHCFITAERGRADTFLILGNPVTLIWMPVLSGYLVAAIGYRWMFVIEGMSAIGWRFLFRQLVDNRPRDAAWLNGCSRAGAGPKSSPSRPRRCWPGTAGWPRASTT